MDDIDREILTALQGEAAISKAELGRRVGLTGPAVLDRLRRLEKRGVILGRSTRLSPSSLGLGMLAFVFVRTTAAEVDRAAERIAGLDSVQEVHHIAGEDCLLLKVRASSADALGRLLRRGINTIPGVNSTRTTIALETVKETTVLPLRARKD